MNIYISLLFQQEQSLPPEYEILTLKWIFQFPSDFISSIVD